MKVQDVIELNKVVKCVKNEKNQILFPTLDPNTIKLVLYTDVSFNNLLDSGSQGDHKIFLTNFHNKCCPLIWNSSKIKRVVCSTLAAETLALNEGCETVLYLSQILGVILHLEHIFFKCYLAVPQPSLGHSQGDSLTNLMLITAFVHIRLEGHREPRNHLPHR